MAKERCETKSTPNSANSNSSERDQGPTMVIHVCDEAKNCKCQLICGKQRSQKCSQDGGY